MLAWHRRSNEDQQSDYDRACPNDHELVLLELLLGSLLGSCRRLPSLSECVPGCGRADDRFACCGLLNRCSASAAVLSIWLNHFVAPFAGATNAIGTRTGRSTSSACATCSNNRSLDSLKVGRSNMTTPSALSPGASRRAVIR